MNIILLIISVVVTKAGKLRKCCDFDEYFEKANGTYRCKQGLQNNLHIFTDETNTFGNDSVGECTEIVDDFYEFNITGTGVVQLKQVNNYVYPKCCPLDFFYNTTVLNCQKKYGQGGIYSNGTLVRIGMPHCKAILDSDVGNSTNILNSFKNNSTTSVCIEMNEESSFTQRECTENMEICKSTRCIKKCCPNGQSFISTTAKCFDTGENNMDLSEWGDTVPNIKEPRVLIYESSCGNLAELTTNDLNYNFSLDQQGVFSITINGFLFIDDVEQEDSYCVEHMKNATIDKYLFYICASRLEHHYIYFFYPLIMSCVFLPLTVAVYILLGETKKLFGKILVCYSLAILIWFLKVVMYVVMEKSIIGFFCRLSAYSGIFTRTSSFTWLNVLCWDIWHTFGSTKRDSEQTKKKNDSRKMLIYSIYGWGLPLTLMLSVMLFFTWDNILPTVIQPSLLKGRCVFEKMPGNYAATLFVNGPMTVIETTSVLLFVRTVFYCTKVKNDINKMTVAGKEDSMIKYRREKEKLLLVMKLMVIMGVNFVFEAIFSFFTDMYLLGTFVKYMEASINCINASQGLLIFIITVCNRRILDKFRTKMTLLKREVQQDSVSSLESQSTTVSADIPMHKK